MQPVWLCILLGGSFEDTFENTHWRKVKQMWPMLLCIFWSKEFKGPFENTQVRPMQLCIFSGIPFKETFQNTRWRKVEQMQPMWLCILSGRRFEKTFENTQRRKVNKYNWCVFVIEYIHKSRNEWINPIRNIWHHIFKSYCFVQGSSLSLQIWTFVF